MSRQWQPGDVALVRIGKNYQPEVAVRSTDQWFVAGPRLGSRHGWYDTQVEVIRPLVVIDPEDREQLERLARAYEATWAGKASSTESTIAIIVRQFQAALRELAVPTPPEPADPKARVTDRRENVWRLLADGDWVCTSGPDIGEYLAWSRLAVERGPVEVES